jgi:pimeloyl-ACP methyl ester carboxylesterase
MSLIIHRTEVAMDTGGRCGVQMTDGYLVGRRAQLKAQARSRSGWTAHVTEPTDFVEAVGLSRVDVPGFSVGSCVAQALTLRHPYLIRRIGLVGTTGKQR